MLSVSGFESGELAWLGNTNCGNAKRSTGPKTEVGKIDQVETLCVMDCQSQRRAQNIVRFDRLAKESDLVRAKLELSRIHTARSALLAAPRIPSWRNACADSIAMNAKLSRSRDGRCAGARNLCQGSKMRQPSPDLFTTETGSSAALQQPKADMLTACNHADP